MEAPDLPKKTPKNLTNNKCPDSDERRKDRERDQSPTEDIDDETPNARDGDPLEKTND